MLQCEETFRSARRAFTIGASAVRSLALWSCVVPLAAPALADEWRIEPLESPVGDALFTAVTLDRQHEIGLVVGGRGEHEPGVMLRTTDGGRSFLPVECGSPGRLYDVAFTDECEPVSTSESASASSSEHADPRPRAVVAVGLDGVILRSIDDGAVWTSIRQGSEWWAAVAFPTRTRGFVVGAEGGTLQMLRSDDAGMSFSTVSLPRPTRPGVSLRALSFADEHHGLLVGSEGALYETRDGGDRWTSVPTEAAYLRGIAFGADGTRLVVGGAGTVLRSEPNSESWHRLAFPREEKLNSVRFVGERRVLLSTMEGGLWCSDDRGSSFVPILNLPGRHLTGIVAPVGEHPGLVVGAEGYLASIRLVEAR